MKKSDYVSGTTQKLQNWLTDLKSQIGDPRNSVSTKLQDYLKRQLTDQTMQSSAPFLKQRTTIILYLNEAWDSTENPMYSENEVRFVIGLLTPDDFNPDADCIYCLKGFISLEELQKHYETCSI